MLEFLLLAATDGSAFQTIIDVVALGLAALPAQGHIVSTETDCKHPYEGPRPLVRIPEFATKSRFDPGSRSRRCPVHGCLRATALDRVADGHGNASHGWRQLPWRRDDNYLGGLNTGAGPVREAGLS